MLMLKRLKNLGEAKGTIWYGLHFYPGVAEYKESDTASSRVFLNEDTLRSMDPSFAGCPLFVHHVDEIETDIEKLRSEAQGWVIESFYNQADGKHWVKFVTVSGAADRAIRSGMQLSNCYKPTQFGSSGVWNGVSYDKEIKAGDYEHLAIVPNPRYEESIILSPEEFKKYNDDNLSELKRLSNENGEKQMGFTFFKRTKVENSDDLSRMSVTLPKSGVEASIARLINEADEKEAKKDEPKFAEGHHLVDCNGKTMSVNEMVEEHKQMKDAMEEKEKNEGKEEEKDHKENEEDDDLEYSKSEPPMSKDDKMGAKRASSADEEEKKEDKKANAKDKANRLRNANAFTAAADEGYEVELPMHKLAKGRALFGS